MDKYRIIRVNGNLSTRLSLSRLYYVFHAALLFNVASVSLEIIIIIIIILKFILTLNVVLLLWKLSAFELLLHVYTMFHVLSMLFQCKVLLHAFQLLMLFVETLMYLDPKWFLFIIFYRGSS